MLKSRIKATLKFSAHLLVISQDCLTPNPKLSKQDFIQV